MKRCPPLHLHHFQILSSLKTLELRNSRGIVFPLVEGEGHAEYQFPIECLTIGWSDASAKELTQQLAYFRKLSDLSVLSCEKITGLGVAEKEKQATATPVASSFAMEADDAQIEQHQLQDDTRGEEEIAAEGLLLLPPQIQKLRISLCRELSLCSITVNHNREAGRIGGGQGFQGLCSLQLLEISYCPRFLSSYSSSSFSPCFPFPASLEHLSLGGVDGIETLLPLSQIYP
ncbi:disease resistance protein RGA2-like [Panicum miliaceum]|uniref:Disease resistance protein RGA2-like n=1 Tax=Panicum miliaceum TaxID=4540 RepID=A0A3L6Q2I1_PANMI|nr:disease resistance protein RGA2-like [Panicum miliaceum]